VLIVAYFTCKIRRLRAKVQHEFARRVAETIKLTPGSRLLTPEALAVEFKKIDTDNTGNISKEELWEFVASGKVATMTRPEFDALFAVMDSDSNGTVDFLEFCAYMCECQSEFEEAKNRKSIQEVRMSFAVKNGDRTEAASAIARQLSSRMSLTKIGEPDEEEVKATPPVYFGGCRSKLLFLERDDSTKFKPFTRVLYDH
jgi:hypothetical protein